MTTQQIQNVPVGFSLPEFVVFTTLIRLGRKPDIDFTFQGALFGGRAEKGGLVIDFLFDDPPGLAINVQGEFFHQEQGADVTARDRLTRAALAGEGITLIFIDAEDALSEPERFVRAALNYQDLSFLGGVGG